MHLLCIIDFKLLLLLKLSHRTFSILYLTFPHFSTQSRTFPHFNELFCSFSSLKLTNAEIHNTQ